METRVSFRRIPLSPGPPPRRGEGGAKSSRLWKMTAHSESSPYLIPTYRLKAFDKEINNGHQR
jgi:hypothetical protein